MARHLSMEQIRKMRPAQYQSWVRTACIFVALSYCANFLAHQSPGEGWNVAFWDSFELLVLGLAPVCYVAARVGYPRVASWVLLVAVAAEFSVSLLVESRHQAFEAALGLSALITGVALLLGARMALAWAVVISVGLAVPHLMGWASAMGEGAAALGPIVGALSGMLVTAGLLFIFQRSYGEVVGIVNATERATREVIEDSPDGIVTLYDDGSVEIANGRAIDMLGLGQAETVQRSPSSPPRLHFLLRGQERPLTKFSELPIVLEDGSRPLLAELTQRSVFNATAQAGRRFLEGRLMPRALTGGWLLVLRDMTAQRVMEERTRELKLQLEHAQKMEAVGRLAGGVAHDFNNLLMVISGYAEILAESEEGETAQLARAQLEATERCTALTRQLLAFARKEVVARKPLELCAVLEACETLVQRLLGEQVTLDLHLEPPAIIVADAGQIEQIIMNLAANARDAMPEGGTFSIHCAPDESGVMLNVSDTGLGMDAATRAHAFEPFFTTKSKGKGTGLGLATVHAIVTDHDGTIAIGSEQGQGTTFSMRFPLSELTLDSLDEGIMDRVTPNRHGRILVVDDTKLTLEVVCRQLRRSGYDVISATSGSEALGILKSPERTPELLLTDVIMPAMSGPELAQRARQELPHLPVLFMSGYIDDVLQTDHIDVEKDLILKPFSRDLLVERVDHKLLRRSQMKALG